MAKPNIDEDLTDISEIKYTQESSQNPQNDSCSSEPILPERYFPTANLQRTYSSNARVEIHEISNNVQTTTSNLTTFRQTNRSFSRDKYEAKVSNRERRRRKRRSKSIEIDRKLKSFTDAEKILSDNQKVKDRSSITKSKTDEQFKKSNATPDQESHQKTLTNTPKNSNINLDLITSHVAFDSIANAFGLLANALTEGKDAIEKDLKNKCQLMQLAQLDRDQTQKNLQQNEDQIESLRSQLNDYQNRFESNSQLLEQEKKWNKIFQRQGSRGLRV